MGILDAIVGKYNPIYNYFTNSNYRNNILLDVNNVKEAFLGIKDTGKFLIKMTPYSGNKNIKDYAREVQSQKKADKWILDLVDIINRADLTSNGLFTPESILEAETFVKKNPRLEGILSHGSITALTPSKENIVDKGFHFLKGIGSTGGNEETGLYSLLMKTPLGYTPPAWALEGAEGLLGNEGSQKTFKALGEGRILDSIGSATEDAINASMVLPYFGKALKTVSGPLKTLYNNGKFILKNIPRNPKNFYRAVDKEAIQDAKKTGLIRATTSNTDYSGPYFGLGHEGFTRNYVIEGKPDATLWIDAKAHQKAFDTLFLKPRIRIIDGKPLKVYLGGLGYLTQSDYNNILKNKITPVGDNFEAYPYFNGSTELPINDGFSYWKKYPIIGWRNKKFKKGGIILKMGKGNLLKKLYPNAKKIFKTSEDEGFLNFVERLLMGKITPSRIEKGKPNFEYVDLKSESVPKGFIEGNDFSFPNVNQPLEGLSIIENSPVILPKNPINTKAELLAAMDFNTTVKKKFLVPTNFSSIGRPSTKMLDADGNLIDIHYPTKVKSPVTKLPEYETLIPASEKLPQTVKENKKFKVSKKTSTLEKHSRGFNSGDKRAINSGQSAVKNKLIVNVLDNRSKYPKYELLKLDKIILNSAKSFAKKGINFDLLKAYKAPKVKEFLKYLGDTYGYFKLGGIIKAEEGTKFGRFLNNYGKTVFDGVLQIYGGILKANQFNKYRNLLKQWKLSYINSITPEDFSKLVDEEEKLLKQSNPDYNSSPIVKAYRQGILQNLALLNALKKASQEADLYINLLLSLYNNNGYEDLISTGLGIAGLFLSNKKLATSQ